MIVTVVGHEEALINIAGSVGKSKALNRDIILKDAGDGRVK